MKTTEEIQHLKNDWLIDPCWDIEDTEGFEDYHQELYIFRLETELANTRKNLDKWLAFAKMFNSLITPNMYG